MNNINNNVNFGSLNVINKHKANLRWTNIERLYNKNDKAPDHILKLWVEGRCIYYDYVHPNNDLLNSCGTILLDGVEKLADIKADMKLVEKLQKFVDICRANYLSTPTCYKCIEKLSEKCKGANIYTLYAKHIRFRDEAFRQDEIFKHINVDI